MIAVICPTGNAVVQEAAVGCRMLVYDGLANHPDCLALPEILHVSRTRLPF